MTVGQRYLFQGIDAYKRKDFDGAEKLLLSALETYSPHDGGRRTAFIHLGMIYRRLARFDEAISALERGLPYPAAFGELKGIYRFFGKACKKDKDSAGVREHFAKLYSLSMIETMIGEQRLPMPERERWMESLRGMLYWYRPDANGVDRIERAKSLSAADCKLIRFHLTEH
jgi:tetratricopeptide (TPR) repeat protein